MDKFWFCKAHIAEGRRKKEEGRRKKEGADVIGQFPAMISAINNVRWNIGGRYI
ncbi:hypothetical protein QUB70_21435 [Microcoleus sp. A003_D6]|uniref:hypothetical protein n=1 Tax=Microcoleus sp. A003_D6 TaxID=3055266 RepID=UPI002FD74C37